MSKVKIQGNASGTGVLTVTAPNTSTDRTITLPDSTGTLATTADTFNPDAAVTINESGADVDFRVESDNDANALFVQGSNGLVGIGTSSPPDGISLTVSNDGSGAHQAGIRMIDTNSGNHHQIYVNAGSIYFRDVTAGTTRMVINSSGVMSVPNGIELGSGIDATAANTLDDYEEGTWTPALSGVTGNFNTSTNQIYTKIGRFVTLRGYVYNASSISDTSATWRISGLPFAPMEESANAVGTYAVNLPSDTAFLVMAAATNSTLKLVASKDNQVSATLTFGDVGGGHIDFSITYMTNA